MASTVWYDLELEELADFEAEGVSTVATLSSVIPL